MSYVCFYPQSMEVFDIYQIDGITWFIIDKNTHDSCEVINKCRVQEYYNSSIMRPLLGREAFLILVQKLLIVYTNINILFLGNMHQINIKYGQIIK